MKPYIASRINAIILIIFASWAYFSSETPSFTALIPLFIGVVLLLLNSGVKKEAKIPAHIAVLLTLIACIGLIKPLFGTIEKDSLIGIVRVCIMLLSSVFAMVTFIRSFIEVRRQRNLNKHKN